MRSKIPEPELLEPLAVEIGGIVRPPEPASHPVSARAVTPTAHEVIDAGRATITEARVVVRGQSPWVQSSAVDVRPPPTVHRMAAFSRMLALQPARLDALPAWWTRRASDGRVGVARRLVVEAPTRCGPGTWCFRGRLRSPWRARAIPVEVTMWSHLGIWTKLQVEPQRGVRVGRCYFRSGHRVLDVLTDRLIREL